MDQQVQQHVLDVMSSLATYVFIFFEVIILGYFIDPFYWNTMIVLSLIGLFCSFIATTCSSTNKRLYSYGIPFFFGLMISPMMIVTSLIDNSIIMFAGFGTIVIFMTMFFHALYVPLNHYHFSGPLLYSCLSLLCYVSFCSMVFDIDLLDTFELLFGLIIFALFIAYDTNNMIRRASHRVITDENRDAMIIEDSLNLFLDVLNLFVRLIKIGMKMSKNHKSK